jgi:hypothetical protein
LVKRVGLSVQFLHVARLPNRRRSETTEEHQACWKESERALQTIHHYLETILWQAAMKREDRLRKATARASSHDRAATISNLDVHDDEAEHPQDKWAFASICVATIPSRVWQRWVTERRDAH